MIIDRVCYNCETLSAPLVLSFYLLSPYVLLIMLRFMIAENAGNVVVIATDC